jgi:FKBP-type peptidyl-prolyl cis-trans isomerase (trigger factor)
LKLGATLDDVMEALAADLTKEAEADYQARRRLAVARELVRRTPFQLDTAIIEHELGRRWLTQEGRFLARRRLSEPELVASFRGWREDATLWAMVEADVRGALLVRALLESGRLTLTADDLAADLVELAMELGATSAVEAKVRLQREVSQSSLPLNAAVMNSALEKLAAAAIVTAP